MTTSSTDPRRLGEAWRAFGRRESRVFMGAFRVSRPWPGAATRTEGLCLIKNGSLARVSIDKRLNDRQVPHLVADGVEVAEVNLNGLERVGPIV